VANKDLLRAQAIDRLVFNGVFHENPEIKQAARNIVRESARALGIQPASILPLYEAMGRGECKGFTVPAINIRGLTYDMARAVFRAALLNQVGAVIFEIARSEIGYTAQRPSEYAHVVIAAAIKEGFTGPLFIQGDHFQA
ncbi:MAG TPA: aldolase, partial [Deltaproteobacteria bacterium]|nr:aldolase [Deltaproteobacteria bacterium]